MRTFFGGSTPSTGNWTAVKPGGATLSESPGGIGINTEPGGATAGVFDSGGKSFGIVALVLALAALLILAYNLGAEHKESELGPQVVDSKIAAGVAQAEATAREARTTAKVTEDKLTELRDALNAKGANLPKLDGH